MSDLTQTIVPKSDQLNADDLIAGPVTITIREVRVAPGSEQPASVHYEDDNGKPYKPCKSMRRLLVMLWGGDHKQFAGRRLTLYREASVRFGRDEVGGIRISHMSHIDGPQTVPLTVTRGSRKPYTVKPLTDSKGEPPSPTRPSLAGGAPPGASPSIPGDLVTFAGETHDPLRPVRIAPRGIDEMSNRELQDFGRALRELIERAPVQTRAGWINANADDLLSVKNRSTKLHGFITEPASTGVAAPAGEGAPGFSGGATGAPSTEHDAVG